MKHFIDIETSGLFKTQLDISNMQIHCVVIVDETEDAHLFYKNDESRINEYFFEINDTIIGHNILGFDLWVLREKCMEYTNYKRSFFSYNLIDTLLLSQLMFPDLYTYDQNNYYMLLPKSMWGSHSLEAWGKRLGFPKIEHTDFSAYSPEMLKYCENDTRLCKKLYEFFQAHPRGLPPENVIRMENDFKIYTMIQQLNGVPYDIKKADQVLDLLEEDWKSLKHWGSTELPVKEIPYKKAGREPKKVPFNITSRDQIADFLIKKYEWEPTLRTEKANKPQINDDILSTLPYPEAEKFAKAFTIGKMKAFIKSGSSSWFNNFNSTTGRIHGSINTLGTNTGRCAHHSPNLAQVPSTRAYMGKELRSLFYSPSPGTVFVGCDASGLELRCLAHYLTPYDDGEYARIVLEGDVHSYNQRAAELPSRDVAKTFIYALIYGAGNTKLGATINPKLEESEQAALGAQARQKFLKGIKGFDELSFLIRQAARDRGYIFAIDKRKIYVEKEHTSLNYLLQSCGAIIMKQATCLFYQRAKHLIQPVLHIHDEFQVICKEEDAVEVGNLAVSAIQNTADVLGFRVRLDGKYQIGQNWSECH